MSSLKGSYRRSEKRERGPCGPRFLLLIELLFPPPLRKDGVTRVYAFASAGEAWPERSRLLKRLHRLERWT